MKILKIGLGILLFAGMVVGGMKLIKERKLKENREKPAMIYPLKVSVLNLEDRKISLTLPYLGEVKNDKSVIINSKFSGKLNYVKQLGDKVQKGEIVAKIDNKFLKSKLDEVNAQITATKESLIALKVALNNLIDTHRRTKKLLSVKIASKEQYNNEATKIAQTKAEIKSNEAKLLSLDSTKNSLQNDLTYTEIISPIDGVVSNKFLNIGDNAFSGKPILKISSQKGNYIFITLPNKPKGVIFDNKFYQVIDLKTTFNGLKGYKVKIEDNSLIEGEKVKIKVVNFQGQGRFLPFDAILTIGGKNFVLVPQGSRAEALPITILASGSEGVIIKEDIFRVIKANSDILLRLKAGYPIKVIGG